MSLDADFSVSLTACLDRLTAAVGGLDGKMAREHARRVELANHVRSVPFGVNVPLSGGATLTPYFSQSPNLGPAAGYMWSVRALIAQNYTAGTVNVWRDSPSGEIISPFPQAGLATFGRGERLLWPMSQMVVTATGIVGTLQIYGQADLFPQAFLAQYNLGID